MLRASRFPRRGFTLMELLVVMGVFSLTVAMTSAIFLQANRAQRRVLALTAAQADLRFALEAIVREVRSGRVDYGRYANAGGVEVPEDRLIILTAAGPRLEFLVETSTNVCPEGVARCLAVRNEAGTSQSLTSTGVELDAVAFIISPQVDPFTIDAASGLYSADVQPTVTVALTARTISPRVEDVVTMRAQTTVTARTYVR